MNMGNLSKFSERLFEKMVERHITQKTLAEWLGTTQQSVSNWVKGVYEPDFSTLLRICLFLSEDANFMLGYDEITKQSL